MAEKISAMLLYFTSTPTDNKKICGFFYILYTFKFGFALFHERLDAF